MNPFEGLSGDNEPGSLGGAAGELADDMGCCDGGERAAGAEAAT
jgi:hypothetical protein